MDDEDLNRRGDPGTAGEWAAVCLVVVLTVVILLPPAWYVLVHASESPLAGWPTIQAQHDAAVKMAGLVVAFPAGGAVLGGLATLLVRRPLSWAKRADVMATVAFVASLALTVGGFFIVLGQPRF